MIGGSRTRDITTQLRGEPGGAIAIAAAIAFTALSEGGYGVMFSAVAGLLIWWVLLCALAVRPAGVPVAGAASVAFILLAAYSLWAVLSALWAPDAGGAVYEAAKLLAYAGAFGAIIVLGRRGSEAMWVWGLAMGLATVAAIALSVRFFPALEGDRETLQASLPSAEGRLGFPLGYWNALAACMAMLIVLLGPLAVFSRRLWLRGLCTALIPLPVLAIFLASSRGGAVAAVLGALVVLLLVRNRMAIAGSYAITAPACLLVTAFAADQERMLLGIGSEVARAEGLSLILITALAVIATFLARVLLDAPLSRLTFPARLRKPAVITVLILVGAAMVAADPAERWEQFKSPPSYEGSASGFVASHLQSGNGNGRYQFWGTALDALADEPLSGLGAGGFESYWNRNGPIEYRLRDAHGLLFETVSELGIVGAASILGFLVLTGWVGLRRAFKERRDTPTFPSAAILVGVLAAGLAAVLVDWTWEIPSVALPILLAAGLLTCRPHGTAPATGSAALPAHFRVGMIITAVVALTVLGNVYLTELQLRESRTAISEDDFDGATDAAGRAAALAPWAAAPRVQQALIAERLGDIDASRELMSEAIERAPEDWKLRVIAGRMALEASDAEAAEQLLEDARRLNPRSAILQPRPLPPGILPGDEVPPAS
jgi:hypothetical protein